MAEWLWRRFQERPVSGLVVNLPVGKTARVRIPPLSEFNFLFFLPSHHRDVKCRICFEIVKAYTWWIVNVSATEESAGQDLPEECMEALRTGTTLAQDGSPRSWHQAERSDDALSIGHARFGSSVWSQ